MSTPFTIDSFEFLRIKGPQIPSLAAAIEIIDRPGVDSIASRENANKASDITLSTIEAVTSQSIARSRSDDYDQLRGTRVTIVDELGRSVDNVLILSVQVTSVKKIGTSTDSSAEYLVFANWHIKPTQ